jgi:multiple sugar transport system ATP-binding protein
MASVTFEKVVKRYGHVTAVDNLNLHIPDQEFLVFVGPSGCGKSTSLRLLAGLEDLSGGVIYIDGRPVNEVAPKDRDIAMVFQSYALYRHLSVYDNLAFALKLRQLPKAEIDRRVKQVAHTLGLEPLLPRKPRQLSGAQQQRVAVGRAIVREPQVFLFDEPLSNLDAQLRVQTRAELIQLHRQLATTFIYVTHDQTEAMTMGTRIAVMKDGRLQQVDAPQTLYDRPNNIFVAGFIGSPGMNFFDVSVAESGDNLMVDGDAFRFSIPVERATGLRPYVGQVVSLGLRPEDLFDAEYVAQNIQPGRLDAKVEVTELMGSEVYLYVLTGKTSYVARVDRRTWARVGSTVRLAANLDKAHFFDKATEQAIR